MIARIDHCEKRAGVFTGARTYQLILTEEGLYILELGKAMGAGNKSNPLADKILDKLEAKRAAQHAEKSHQISTAGPNEQIDGKKNFLVTRANMQQVTANHFDQSCKLSIQSVRLS